MPMATAEKQREYQRKWIRGRRQHYLKKYGPCLFCESNDDLQIHHVDPDKPENTHLIWSLKPEKIEKELQGCVILCRKCHSTFHTLAKKRPLEHGTRYGYRGWGCRCPECLKAHSQYNMTHR